MRSFLEYGLFLGWGAFLFATHLLTVWLRGLLRMNEEGEIWEEVVYITLWSIPYFFLAKAFLGWFNKKVITAEMQSAREGRDSLPFPSPSSSAKSSLPKAQRH